MNYNIDCLISNKDQACLKRFLQVKPVSITMAEDGDYTPAICLSNNGDRAYIVNSPTLQIDNDEYPKITLIPDIKYNYKWRCLAEGTIKKITVIRDEVTWEWNGNKWLVNQDSGLKIYINSIQIAVTAIDSVGGLIKCSLGDNVPIQVSKEELGKHWSLKTDFLGTAIRKEIDIS